MRVKRVALRRQADSRDDTRADVLLCQLLEQIAGLIEIYLVGRDANVAINGRGAKLTHIGR